MIEWKIIDSKTQKSSNTGSQIAKKGRKKGGTEGRRARRAGRAAEPTFEILPTRFAEWEGFHLLCSAEEIKSSLRGSCDTTRFYDAKRKECCMKPALKLKTNC